MDEVHYVISGHKKIPVWLLYIKKTVELVPLEMLD